MTHTRVTPGSAARIASAILLAGPAILLAATGSRFGLPLLFAQAAGSAVIGLVLFRYREAWKPPVSALVILLYLAALSGIVVATPMPPDAFTHFARGLLLMTAIGLFVGHDLNRSGLGPRRRARGICRQLAARSSWPTQFADFENIPEIAELQVALHDDPSPALAMLTHSRIEVQAAAVLALQDRPSWRPGDAFTLVQAMRQMRSPEMRAAAVLALATADDSATVAEVSSLLRDPSPQVRAAASQAIVVGGNRRWAEVRALVRDALADPLQAEDGPLAGAESGRLTAMAETDLHNWAAEGQPLAHRAVCTLIKHYSAKLHASRVEDHQELPAKLSEYITDPQTPAALRVDLANLLFEAGLITPELLDRMTDADQLGPIRLLAAEMLLSTNPEHPDALDVLRGLGRQPNREMALKIAFILQRYLQLDMGIPEDGQAVAPASRVATEAARRVLHWATGGKAGTQLADQKGMRLSRPLSAPTLSGIQGTSDKPQIRDTEGPWTGGR